MFIVIVDRFLYTIHIAPFLFVYTQLHVDNHCIYVQYSTARWCDIVIYRLQAVARGYSSTWVQVYT